MLERNFQGLQNLHEHRLHHVRAEPDLPLGKRLVYPEEKRGISERMRMRQRPRLEVPESRLLIQDAPHKPARLHASIRQSAMDSLHVHPVDQAERKHERRAAWWSVPQAQTRASPKCSQQGVVVRPARPFKRIPLRKLPPSETGIQLAQLDVESQTLVGKLVARSTRHCAHHGIDVALARSSPVDYRINKREILGIPADDAAATV